MRRAESQRTPPWSGRELAWVVAGAILMTVLLLGRTALLLPGDPLFARPIDHHKYLWMAGDPFGLQIAPFGWRVGMPLLVSLLPVVPPIGFLIVTVLSICLTAALLYLLLRAAGYSRLVALVGGALYFSIPWLAKFQLYDYWLPDALAGLLITTALLAIVRGRWLGTLLAFSAGLLVKESVLVALPLLYTLPARHLLDGRALRRALLIALLPLTVLVGVRVAVPSLNDDPAYVATLPPSLALVQREDSEFSVARSLTVLLPERLAAIDGRELYRWSVGAYGVLPLLLALVGALSRPLLLLRLLPMLLIGFAQPLIAINLQRLVVLPFAAVLWLAAEGTRRLGQRIPAAPAALLAAALLIHLPNLAIVNRFEPGVETGVLLYQIGVLALVGGSLALHHLRSRQPSGKVSS